eukprot:226624_1
MTVIYRVHRSLIFEYWFRTLVDCYTPGELLDMIHKYCCENSSDDQGTDFRRLKIVSHLDTSMQITYFKAIYGLSFGKLRSEIRQHLQIGPSKYIRIMQRSKGEAQRFSFSIVNTKRRNTEMPHWYFDTFGSQIIIDENPIPKQDEEVWIFITLHDDLDHFKEFTIPYGCHVGCHITYKQFIMKSFETLGETYKENDENGYTLSEYKYCGDKDKQWLCDSTASHAQVWSDFEYLLEHKQANEGHYSYGWNDWNRR